MPITAPPTIPQITDPSTFATRAQDWVVWQSDELYPALVDEATLIGLSTSTTSVTSNTVGTGSKSFTVETGKGFKEGQSITIARTAAPANRMFAVVDSYNTGTGALVVTSQAFEGSGTFTDWTITLGFNGVISAGQIPDASIAQAKLNFAIGRQVAQIQTFQTGAVATGTTQIPNDNTIPQQTEGDQYLSLTITPQSATSTLEIDVTIFGTESTNVAELYTYALFQDSTASAIAAGQVSLAGPATTGAYVGTIKHIMTSGTTSATTFKVRAGLHVAGTFVFNGGAGGAQLMGGVYASRITVKEYLP